MQEVYNQLFCLFVFVITGVVIGLLFDIFRIWRKSFKTADLVTYLQDILFWILAGCIMLFSIFTFNNGEIRSYVFIGIALGIIIYMLTLSKFLIKSSVAIIQFFKKILSYPIRIIINIINKILINPISKFLKFVKGKIIKINKKLQNTTKFKNKIGKKGKKMKEKEGILQKM